MESNVVIFIKITDPLGILPPLFENPGNFPKLVTFDRVTLNLMNFICLESALKPIHLKPIVKILFYRVSVSITPSRSLLAVRYPYFLIF